MTAPLGAWEILPATEESRWSERAKELLGFSGHDEVTYDRFLSTMQASDRVRCIEAFLRAIEPDGDATFRVEYPLYADASRWVALTGGAFVDDRPSVRLVGTIQDVSAEKMRNARLAELRHDLRAPLHGICIAAELMRGASTSDAADLALRIRSMAQRAARMVDRLVGAASRDEGTLPLRSEPLSLSELCADVVAEVLLSHRDRSVRVDAPTACCGEWDGDRLFQMVRNLVWNAVEHGDPRSPAIVSLAENARHVLLTVANAGKPIPAAVRDRLLDPTAPRRNGRGFGLVIVHEIVAAHAGAIELSSDDARTLVRVRLPKRRLGEERSRRV
jgi:signal transduction histidine kinase